MIKKVIAIASDGVGHGIRPMTQKHIHTAIPPHQRSGPGFTANELYVIRDSPRFSSSHQSETVIKDLRGYGTIIPDQMVILIMGKGGCAPKAIIRDDRGQGTSRCQGDLYSNERKGLAASSNSPKY